MMIKSILALVLIGVCVNAQLLPHDPAYCYSKDYLNFQYKFFGTATPYDEVRGIAIDLNLSKCTPSRFWFQGRHGSRYPESNEFTLSPTDDINQQIVNNYEAGNAPNLCTPDVESLKAWTNNANFTAFSSVLMESGWTELTKLAQRYQAAFPTLLPKSYSPSHYFFRRSPTERTLNSAQAFARGLFNGDFNQVTFEGGSSPDMFLTPFYFCPEWINVIARTPVPEVVAFKQSVHYTNMVKQVNEKLGFSGSSHLSADTIERMLTHCKFDKLNDRADPSPFCAAFSYANHQVLVYEHDLQLYATNGYGYPQYRSFYENMACNMVNAMLKFLQSNDQRDQKAQIWYGHDATLHFVFVALGWYEDEILLRADNFATQQHRKWSTSQITPKGANLVAVRYDCPNGDNEVLFLHNEKPVQIPGCQINGICKVSLILQRYARFLNANCAEIACNTNTRL